MSEKKPVDPLKVVNSGLSGVLSLEESKRIVEQAKAKRKKK